MTFRMLLLLGLVSCDEPRHDHLIGRGGVLPQDRHQVDERGPHDSSVAPDAETRWRAAVSRFKELQQSARAATPSELASLVKELEGSRGGASDNVVASVTLLSAYRALDAATDDETIENELRTKSGDVCRTALTTGRQNIKLVEKCVSLDGQGTEEARRLLEEVLRVDPDNPRAHHLLAQALARSGNLKDAIVHSRLAVDHETSVIIVADYRAALVGYLYAAGRAEEADQLRMRIMEGQ